MNKRSKVQSLPASGLFSQVASRVRSWFEIPYGYEDEAGFHFGEQPVPTELRHRRATLTDRACDVMTYPTVLPEALPATEGLPGPQLRVEA